MLDQQAPQGLQQAETTPELQISWAVDFTAKSEVVVKLTKDFIPP